MSTLPATTTTEREKDFRDLADYVYDELRRGNDVLVEAYPGFGKTKMASRLFPRFDRSVVVVRTHREMQEVVGFTGGTVRVAYGYGKPRVCHKTDCFSYGFCRAMISFGRCSTKVDDSDVAWIAARFRTPDEVRDESARRGRCLYFAIRALIRSPSAKHVVATYDYAVSHPEVLSGRDVAILDEAQTVMEYLDELAVPLNEGFVNYLASGLKRSPGTRQLAYALRTAYRKASGIHEFADILSKVLESVDAKGSEEVDTLEAVLRSYESGRYVCRGKDCFFLTGSLPKVVEFSPKLMLGAYLPPMLRSAADTVVRVGGEARVRVYVDTEVSSRYEERGEEVYRAYARKLAEYVRRDVGNLAVFPSRAFMAEVLSRLEGAVNVVSEPAGNELRPSEVLVDVAGGRFTEGVNIRGLGNVVVLGMPYPEPNPVVDLLSKVYRFDCYTYIAMLRTVQAVGRIRGRGTAYLVDRRYMDHLDLPEWMQVEGVP